MGDIIMATVSVEEIEKYLVDFYELEPEQVSLLLVEMKSSIVKIIKELGKSIDNGDYKSIGTGSHSLKGTLLNFGLVESADISSRIDSEARAGVPVQLLKELFDELQAGLVPLTGDVDD